MGLYLGATTMKPCLCLQEIRGRKMTKVSKMHTATKPCVLAHQFVTETQSSCNTISKYTRNITLEVYHNAGFSHSGVLAQA
jgi:hypothetical protein